MIIIEGPDGAGKTSLARKLHYQLDIPYAPKASDSLEGPVKNICEWVDNDLLSWGSQPVKIYDRYPLISEPIYGPALRGGVPEQMTTTWMRNRTNTFRSMSLVIWCLPPFVNVDENVSQSEDNQMEGVAKNIDTIWSLYATASNMWSGPGMIYDYTAGNTKPRDTHMINLVRRHLTTWKRFS